MYDVTVHNEGSVFGFQLSSTGAREWVQANVATEGWQWMGNTLYVDHRHAGELAEILMGAGFDVH